MPVLASWLAAWLTVAIVLDKLKTNTTARVGVAGERGSSLASAFAGADGIPQSVGHIMTFYCVVRRKSAYYACATASAATSAAQPLIVGCRAKRMGHTPEHGQGKPRLGLGSICCRCCLRQRLFYKLILFYDIAFVLLIVACVAQIAFRIASRQLDPDRQTARQTARQLAECIWT